jgi:NADH-quinone oxidoreductase subunit C
MNQAAITEMLQAMLGDRAVAWTDSCDQHAVTIRPEDLVEVATFLRDDAALAMNMLVDVGGVDYLDFGDDREWRFEVVYQFYSLSRNHRYRVKVAVSDDSVHVPTMATMWRIANWMEREVYDQYGVVFDGHKNLVRILNHEDFEGHPLRKDYPINKRQKLARPIVNLFPEDPEWA